MLCILHPLAVIFEQTVPTEFEYSEYAFLNYAFIHFGNANSAILENDRNFFKTETKLPGSKFHFDLESISFKADAIEVNGFQQFFFIANKTRSGILHRY